MRFELIPTFSLLDDSTYLIWSVRILTPQTAKPGWTYAYEIRKQFVRYRPLDEGSISWGPVGANGLQASVRFEPSNEQYVVGQQVTPHFYFRNTGDQEKDVSFPFVMMRGYHDQINAVDAMGNAIAIDHVPGPVGPVGWIETPFGFGAQHDVRGLPVVLGDVERGDAATVIRAKPGQSVRVRFAVPNFADKDAKRLQTGDIVFSMAKPTRTKSGED